MHVIYAIADGVTLVMPPIMAFPDFIDRVPPPAGCAVAELGPKKTALYAYG